MPCRNTLGHSYPAQNGIRNPSVIVALKAATTRVMLMSLWGVKSHIVVLLQMEWPGSTSMPELGTLASMVSGSPVDLHPNSLSYPDARMDSYREDSGR